MPDTIALIQERLSPDCSFSPSVIYQGLQTLLPMLDEIIESEGDLFEHTARLVREGKAPDWAVEDQERQAKYKDLRDRAKAYIDKWHDEHPITCPVCVRLVHHDSCVHCMGCHMLICSECHAKTFTKKNGCNHRSLVS